MSVTLCSSHPGLQLLSKLSCLWMCSVIQVTDAAEVHCMSHKQVEEIFKKYRCSAINLTI